MTTRLFLIKYIHTAIFFFQVMCLLYILYCGITRIYNLALVVAISAIMVNGVLLLFNRWRCPLTTLAERYGAERGSVTDIFLPSWIARKVYKFSLVLFAAELVLLGIGYFSP